MSYANKRSQSRGPWIQIEKNQTKKLNLVQFTSYRRMFIESTTNHWLLHWSYTIHRFHRKIFINMTSSNNNFKSKRILLEADLMPNGGTKKTLDLFWSVCWQVLPDRGISFNLVTWLQRSVLHLFLKCIPFIWAFLQMFRHLIYNFGWWAAVADVLYF